MAAQNGHVPQAPGGESPRVTAKASISVIRIPLIALGLLRATEAVAWTSIFPYAYPMIKSFPGVDETDIPFYAGLLVAVFTFCEFLSGMLWARLSDRVGRKATLLVGSVCGVVTSLSLGLSRSLPLAIASRAFGGLFNPNTSLVQTCVVELTERKEQRAKALSFVTFLRSMGNLIGPVIGGFLADPAALYPSVFPPDSAWTSYRFLLPNLVVALLQAIIFIVAFLALPETHPQLSDKSDVGLRIAKVLTGFWRWRMSRDKHHYAPLRRGQHSDGRPQKQEEDGTDDGEDPGQELQEISTEKPEREPQEGVTGASHGRRKPFTPQIILQIISVSLLAFHKVSSDAIIPTFLAAPPAASNDSQPNRRDFETPRGFGYSNRKVGIILLSQAVVALVAHATLVPFFIDKIGSKKAYRLVLGLYPAMYLATPLLPNLPPAVSLIFLVLDLWIKVVLSSIAYICSAILISSVVPTKTLLARVNGASASFSCLSRSIGPALTGKIFAVGLERGYAGIAFWTLGVVALLGFLESIALREHP